jgi:cytochrome c oxidase subunit 3
MKLFLVSLGVLFAASLAAYALVRWQAPAWPPPDAPALPAGLWFSTLLIIVASVTIQRALTAARRDRRGALVRDLALTAAIGLAFLILQGFNWLALYRRIAAAPLPPTARLFPFTFYMLTALHALHVLGGLVHLEIVLVRARRGRYTARHHAGVEYAAMYWHFLDAVWIIMFVAIDLLA